MDWQATNEIMSEEEFLQLWNGDTPRRTSDAWPDSAAAYLRERLRDADIHLIRTGTIFLFHRRHDSLIEEIAVRMAPKAGLVTVHVYLSHKDLAEIRMRYWRLDSRAPLTVADGNLGQLEERPCYLLWGYGTDPIEIAMAIERYALPWFDVFHEPVELHGLLRKKQVPLVSEDRALELVLAEYGKPQASRFLKHMMEMQPDMERMVHTHLRNFVRSPGSLGFGEDPIRNLAVIAYTYGLLKVRNL